MKKTDAPGLLLCALRSGVGGTAFLAPEVAARNFHIGEGADETYLVRLFAARNLAFTAGLLASRGEARRLWYKAGIVCDVLDVGAGLLGFRAGKKPSSAAADTGASLAATLLGVTALLVERSRGKDPQ
jgi:hypothetical protein